MTSEQNSIYSNHEADSWYLRNQNASTEVDNYPDLDFIFATLKDHKEKIHNVLEIGCAHGYKTFALSRFFDSMAWGIDPSSLAVQHANELGSVNTKFVVGTADDLPFADNSFDLVFFGFCLSVVGREALYKTVAESDRVLRKGGFIALADFDSTRLSRNRNRHNENLFTYRSNYAGIFLASGHYTQVSKMSYSHDKSHTSFVLDPMERVSCQILFKDAVDAYFDI